MAAEVAALAGVLDGLGCIAESRPLYERALAGARANETFLPFLV